MPGQRSRPLRSTFWAEEGTGVSGPPTAVILPSRRMTLPPGISGPWTG